MTDMDRNGPELTDAELEASSAALESKLAEAIARAERAEEAHRALLIAMSPGQEERVAAIARAEAAEAELAELRPMLDATQLQLTQVGRERDRAEAACAQMRMALNLARSPWLEMPCDSSDHPGCHRCHVIDSIHVALATDVGAGWVSPTVHAEVVAERDALEQSVEERRNRAKEAERILAATTKERDEAQRRNLRAVVTITELTKERDEARDTIDAWKEASGLLVGGDPGGVEPRHLAKEMAFHGELLRRARDVLRGVGGQCARDVVVAIDEYFDDAIDIAPDAQGKETP